MTTLKNIFYSVLAFFGFYTFYKYGLGLDEYFKDEFKDFWELNEKEREKVLRGELICECPNCKSGGIGHSNIDLYLEMWEKVLSGELICECPKCKSGGIGHSILDFSLEMLEKDNFFIKMSETEKIVHNTYLERDIIEDIITETEKIVIYNTYLERDIIEEIPID